MMKIKFKILSVCLIVLTGLFVNAQEALKYNIDFKNCSFEEAIKIAKVEGKKIFVDCYAVW